MCGEPEALTSRANRAEQRSGWTGAPSSRRNTSARCVASSHSPDHAMRSVGWRARWAHSTATRLVVEAHRAHRGVRLGRLGAGAHTICPPATVTVCSPTRTVAASRSTADQRSPSSSARRIPMVASSSHPWPASPGCPRAPAAGTARPSSCSGPRSSRRRPGPATRAAPALHHLSCDARRRGAGDDRRQHPCPRWRQPPREFPPWSVSEGRHASG